MFAQSNLTETTPVGIPLSPLLQSTPLLPIASALFLAPRGAEGCSTASRNPFLFNRFGTLHSRCCSTGSSNSFGIKWFRTLSRHNGDIAPSLHSPSLQLLTSSPEHLTPVFATHRKTRPLTPFFATHPKSLNLKSFVCHTSKKWRGWGYFVNQPSLVLRIQTFLPERFLASLLRCFLPSSLPACPPWRVTGHVATNKKRAGRSSAESGVKPCLRQAGAALQKRPRRSPTGSGQAAAATHDETKDGEIPTGPE